MDFAFHGLQIYQLSKTLVIDSYKMTKCFPAEERYALVQQINRAAISIPSNIAEGYSRASEKDKSHFLNIAYGSLMELVCQFEIAQELDYIAKSELEEFLIKAHNLAVKISNFKKTLISDTGKV